MHCVTAGLRKRGGYSCPRCRPIGASDVWPSPVIAASVAIFVIAAPFAKVPLTPVAAFIPIYQSALVLNDLITAVLLFGQFSFLKSRALLVLASGYLFSAAMAVSHALTFRVGDSDARRESTGFGLYYSLRLTELVGGKLTFQSEYGRGSTFTFSLIC
jgi:hypothetical protein